MEAAEPYNCSQEWYFFSLANWVIIENKGGQGRTGILRHTVVTKNEYTALVQTASWHSLKIVPSFLFCNNTVKKKQACFLVLDLSVSSDMFYNAGIRKQNRLPGELQLHSVTELPEVTHSTSFRKNFPRNNPRYLTDRHHHPASNYFQSPKILLCRAFRLKPRA